MFLHVRSADEDELVFRSRALRDACLCLAWSKMMSVICYISLFFVVKLNCNGDLSLAIQIMTLVAMVLVIMQGGILFVGVLQESACGVAGAMFLCILVAAYDMVVGTFSAVYFIVNGHRTVDYFMCVAFALLAVSFFPTMCHDVFIINKYRKTLIEIYGP